MKPIRKMSQMFVCLFVVLFSCVIVVFFIRTYSSALLIANKEIFWTTNLLVFNWYLLFRAASFHSLAGMQSFYSLSLILITPFCSYFTYTTYCWKCQILSSTFICTIVGKNRKKTWNIFLLCFSNQLSRVTL